MPTDEHKRQRVSKACDSCRRRKVKCDGASPVCANCTAFGLECTYLDMTKKRGPPKGYIEAIENRLAKMESLLAGFVQNTNDPCAAAVLAELNAPLETPEGQQIRTRPLRRGHTIDHSTPHASSSAPSSSQLHIQSRSMSSPVLSPASSSMWSEVNSSNINSGDNHGGREAKRALLVNIQPNLHHRYSPRDSQNSDTPSPMLDDFPLMKEEPESYSPTLSAFAPDLLDEQQQQQQQQLNDDMGQLSIDETGAMRFLGRSSGFYLLQQSRSFHDGAFHFSFKERPKPHGERRRLYELSVRELKKAAANPRLQDASINRTEVDPTELPSKELSDHLLSLYFEHLHPVLPVIQKKRFLQAFEEERCPLMALNAVYALASRLSDDPQVRSNPDDPATAGDTFFERAKRLLDEDYDSSRLSTVQALILMAAYQNGTARHPSAWLYSGMAFRMAQDLGLNRNCENWNIPVAERERRTRVFWCCYFLDRVMSASYGRPMTFDDRNIDTAYPQEYSEDSPMIDTSSDTKIDSISYFVQLVKLCEILGKVLLTSYSVRAKLSGALPVDAVLANLDNALTNWFTHLPEHLQYRPSVPRVSEDASSKGPPSYVCQLHMLYYTTLILLHRPLIPGPNQSVPPLSFPSLSICTAAANTILDIADFLQKQDLLKTSYNLTNYYMFTAGVIFINNASSTDPRFSVSGKLNVIKIMKLLEALQKPWLTAGRSGAILGELVEIREINLDGVDEHTEATRGSASEELQQRIKIESPQQMSMSISPSAIASVNSMTMMNSYFTNEQGQQLNKVQAEQGQNKQTTHTSSADPFTNFAQLSLQHQQQQQQQQQQQNQQHQQHQQSQQSPSQQQEQQRQHQQQREQEQSSTSMPLQSLYDFSQQVVFNGLRPSTLRYDSRPDIVTASTSTPPMPDPYAAPGTVPSLPRAPGYDPLGAAFWGVPSSLDMDEWATYFGNQVGGNFGQPVQTYQRLPNMQNHHPQHQHIKALTHGDSVDVLTGVSVPIAAPGSVSLSALSDNSLINSDNPNYDIQTMTDTLRTPFGHINGVPNQIKAADQQAMAGPGTGFVPSADFW